MKKMFLVLSVVFALMISACTVPQEPAPSVPVGAETTEGSSVEAPPLPPPLPGEEVASGDLAGQAFRRGLGNIETLCSSLALPTSPGIADFGCTQAAPNVPLQFTNPLALTTTERSNLKLTVKKTDGTAAFVADLPAVRVFPQKCVVNGVANPAVVADDKCWDNVCTGVANIPAGAVCVVCTPGTGCPDEANRADQVSLKINVPASAPADTKVFLYKVGYIRSRTLSADRTTTQSGVWVPFQWDWTGPTALSEGILSDASDADWYLISQPAQGVSEVRPIIPASGVNPFVMTAGNTNFNMRYFQDADTNTKGDGDNEFRSTEVVYFACTCETDTCDAKPQWSCNANTLTDKGVSRGKYGLGYIGVVEANLNEPDPNIDVNT